MFSSQELIEMEENLPTKEAQFGMHSLTSPHTATPHRQEKVLNLLNVLGDVRMNAFPKGETPLSTNLMNFCKIFLSSWEEYELLTILSQWFFINEISKFIIDLLHEIGILQAAL